MKEVIMQNNEMLIAILAGILLVLLVIAFVLHAKYSHEIKMNGVPNFTKVGKHFKKEHAEEVRGDAQISDLDQRLLYLHSYEFRQN